MTFGQKLKQIRLERRLNQRELAGRAGIDFTYLSKVENGRMDPPAEETICRLAASLDVEPTELLLLAQKVPSDVKPIITRSPLVPRFLRTARDLTDAEWEALIQEVERRQLGPRAEGEGAG
jgi:HTH-type transcriptional regulator, competence development regulator